MTSTGSDPARAHWDGVYSRRPADQVSWYEAIPARSLGWILATNIPASAAVIDVGGGASTLVDELLARGFSDITVLDISAEVLGKVAQRLGDRGKTVTLLPQDITTFRANRRYALWHDRAVFHFMTDEARRCAYREALLLATQPGSRVILSTFGPEGPTRCSGLETARYDAAKLAEVLGKEFRLLRSVTDLHVTPTGVSQQFLRTDFVRE
jgi:hypothetical protein